MMYQFMTLADAVEVAHSDTYDDNGIETVKVYFEKPVSGGFHSSVKRRNLVAYEL